MTPSKSIFITGATGFVGATLVRYFARKGWEVVANGRTEAPMALRALSRYVQADLQNPLPRQEAEVVVHAAALASDSACWADLKRANVDGTRQVFEATSGSRCFIYISSSSVYDFKNRTHTEDEPVDYQQLSPYGRSKRMAEDWLLNQDWRGRRLVILRPRAVYGVGDRVLLPRLLRLVRFGQILAPGDMRVSSSLTHVGNLAAAVEGCTSPQLSGNLSLSESPIFNIADEEPYEMRAVVQRLLNEIHGKNLPFRRLPLRPLRVTAHVLERMKIARQFTPYSLSAISQDNVLALEKASKCLGFIPKQDFWGTLPGLTAWVRGVGVEQVQQAKASLPWV